MSWLLVALIPGLLMMATFGLQRLESSLDGEIVSATEVAKSVERGKSADVTTLPRDGTSRAVDGVRRHRYTAGAVLAGAGTPGLPTRLYPGHGSKTEFRPTRHADRV